MADLCSAWTTWKKMTKRWKTAYRYTIVSRKYAPPYTFSAKFCWGIFIPCISSPPAPLRQRLIPSRSQNAKSRGCLLLKCLPQTRTACINDGHASYFAEVPSSLTLNAEARQPSASVRSISPPRAWPPPSTDNEVMLYRKGGRNRERNCCIPRISHPPPPSVFY